MSFCRPVQSLQPPESRRRAFQSRLAQLVAFLDGNRPSDSAAAIVALERGRSTGANFLAFPAPTNQWLEELQLFADHCRRRYPVVLESELGTVFALRPVVEAGTSSPAPPPADTSADDGEGKPLDAIDALALPLARLVRDGSYSGEEFRRFERRGVHVAPVHFYSPDPGYLAAQRRDLAAGVRAGGHRHER